MLNFRQVLLQEAKEALQDGLIEKNDYRRLFLVSFFPLMLQKLENYCTQLAVEEKVIAATVDTKAIDWNNLKEFIKEVLPLILEFLKGIGVI